MSKNERIRTILGLEYIKKEWYPVRDHMDVHVQDAFAEIVKVNRELFAMIPYEVVFTTDDVYSSAREMRERVKAENKIYIYTEWSGHPILTQEENNIGRAVHDTWSHLVCGCPFSWEGELTAYNEQKLYYPEWTWDVLFAEIVGQTSAYYYVGNHNFDQRAIAAPKRWMELAKTAILPDFSSNSILIPAM
jgi:hypothetical protein